MHKFLRSIHLLSLTGRSSVVLCSVFLFFFLSIEANAKTHTFRVETVAELRAVLGDLNNPDFVPGDTVWILVEDGDYQFDELQDTGNAIPEPPNDASVKVIIDAAGKDVNFIGGGPSSNFRFGHLGPLKRGFFHTFSITDIHFQDFHTDSDGAILSVDIGSGAPVTVGIDNCSVSDVSANNGGAFSASGYGAVIHISNSRFDHTSAKSKGGVLSATDRVSVFFQENEISNSSSFLRGGAVNIEGGETAYLKDNAISSTHTSSQLGSHLRVNAHDLMVDQNIFESSLDSVADKLVAVGGAPTGASFNIENKTLATPDDDSVSVKNNTFVNVPPEGAAIVDMGGSLIGTEINFWLNAVEIQMGGHCTAHPFSSTNINLLSLGGNGTDDPDCTSFNHTGDIFGVDLHLGNEPPNKDVPESSSPLIDINAFDEARRRISSATIQVTGNTKPNFHIDDPTQPGTLPCGYRDIRGLARPQDGDLDGSFDCDAGAYEVQGGEDIGPSQSAAYYDIAHDQEGYFAEVLDGGLAVIGVFTYKRDGSGPAWYTGLGQVVGNSFVVDDLILAKGGVFGDAFDESRITRTTVAGFSANFPDCESTTNPGRWVIDPLDDIGLRDPLGAVSDEELDTLLEEQIQLSTRLNQIISCPASTTARVNSGIRAKPEAQSVNAYRSGNYFASNRSGEGIFVEVLIDGTIIVIWYTYDPQGEPMWILATGTLVGDTVTVDARYPTQFTHFGSTFNPDEIVLSDWGTFTLQFTACNSLMFSYDSTVAEYGSGDFNYIRLTQLAGTDCPAQ